MATTTVVPGRKRFGLSRVIDTRRHSRPKLSRIVLTATAMAISAILLLWLMVWINPSRRGIAARGIAQRGLARPWIAHQATDLEKISGAPRGTFAETNYDSFRDGLRDHLMRAANRPVILYLSAAGILEDPGAVLLRDEAGVIGSTGEGGTPQGAISLEDLLAVFKEAGDRFPSQSRFLIWDAGQVGSDRNLGVYGNGFLPKLKSHLAENPVSRLVILCSCAPGQTSWSSEVDGRSVFGYFVEQGLAGKAIGAGGLTVQSLSRYVQGQVSQWVRNHRQAEQTPVLLGDTTLDFSLPRPRRASVAARADGKAEDEAKAFLKRLERAWTQHDDWLKRRPYRLAPRAWMRYQETLLRAERLFRAGDLNDAEAALGGLPNLASELNRVPAVEGSVALLERQVADRPETPRRSELDAARTNIVEALDRLLGGDDPGAPGDEAAPGGAPPAAAPAGDPPAAAPAGDPPAAADPKGGAAPAKKALGAGGAVKKLGDPPPAPKAAPDPPAKKKASTKLATSSLRSRRRADSPLARLIVPEDERRPLYPEAQLLVWADTYVSRGPDPNAFRGERGEALEGALQTRNHAEDAAAADERISRWIRPWVNEGDRARRKAQDFLFATTPAIPECLEALELADESFKAALKNAETCERALDLVEQLSAELPYYGEWKARRIGRVEVGLDQPFLDLLTAGAELARLIYAEPAQPAGDDRSLAPLEQQIEAIRNQHAAVADAFRNLTDDFHSNWDSGRWRDLDAALCVPLIPAETRMRLIERVRSRPVASSLAGTAEDGSSEPTDPGKHAGGSKSTFGYESVLGRSGAGPEAGEADPVSDPGFWRAASGLARLEIGLLEIGGAKKEDLSTLRDAFDRASRKLSSAPFVEFGEISERIRSVRRMRVALSAEKPAAGRPDDDLEARDRAIRVMPLADSSGKIDRVTENYIRYSRRDLATWLAQRLVEDFDARHAIAVLEKAKDGFGDSEAIRAGLDRAKLVARAGLAIETSAPKQVALEQDGMPLSIKVKAEGEVPAGDAVAFVSFDHSLPLAVKESAPRTDGAGGSLVPIARGKEAEPVGFVVERADSTPKPVSARLEPGAFYRGRIFPKDMSASGIVVRLNPGKEGIDVLLRQSDRRLVRQFGDQFDRHPGQGFLHPHTPLAYRLVINHSLPRATNVWVRYGLDGKDETFVTRPDLRLEPGRPNDEINDRVDTDLHEIPVDKPRYLVVEIRKDNENGRVLFKRRYPFRQILPPEFMRVQDGFDALLNMAYVNVWHLKSDPVSGPSEVTVMLGGQTLTDLLDRGGAQQWWRIYPQPPPPVSWRIHVEKVPDAFTGKVETGVEPPKAQAPPQ